MTCKSSGYLKSNFIHIQFKPALRKNNDYVPKLLSVFPDTKACMIADDMSTFHETIENFFWHAPGKFISACKKMV